MSRLPSTAATRWVLGLVGLVCASVGTARGDDAIIERWMRLYHDSATSVEMHVTDRPNARLRLETKPLLKYTNPVRRVQQHGAVYLWTLDNRPAVVSAFWSAQPADDWRRLNFEWHSLRTEPLDATVDGDNVWKTREPGVEWKPVPKVPEPGRTRRQRLVQMRRIAALFEVEIHTEEKGLRLLRQPVFRYAEETGEGVLDGAIFAYVIGTDPEMFLILEARPDEDGRRNWYAGCVPFTNAALTASHAGNEFWTCEKFPVRVGAPVRDRSAFIHLEVQRLPADLAGTKYAESSSATEGEER